MAIRDLAYCYVMCSKNASTELPDRADCTGTEAPSQSDPHPLDQNQTGADQWVLVGEPTSEIVDPNLWTTTPP